MKNDETLQSIESTSDHQAETTSSPTRRGFLTKVAATGLLGTTGLTIATETTTATETTENHSVETAASGKPGYNNYIRVYGTNVFFSHSYQLFAEGTITAGPNADGADFINGEDGFVRGSVYKWHVDDYYFNGDITVKEVENVRYDINWGK